MFYQKSSSSYRRRSNSYRQKRYNASQSGRLNCNNFNFYDREPFLEGETVNKNLFSDLADQIARSFREGKMTTTKLRQYYEVIVNLQKSNQKEENKKMELNLLIAKAMYDRKRPSTNISDNFICFLKKNIEFVIDGDKLNFEERLEIFKKHFEAIIGYASQYLKNN